MANENKLTTLAQMREFAQKQDARDDQQDEMMSQMRDDLPSSLPNPHKLTFTGAVSGSYDGSEDMTVNIPDEKEQVSFHGIKTAGTGAAYTATVEGIDALTAGASFIMIPHTTSTVAVPTLNVNGLGAKNIRRRVSNSTVTTVASVSTNWLYANKPILMFYDGTYWIADFPRPNANDIYGTVPVASGGTGVTTLDALKALVNPNIKGSGIPTTSTVGTVGDFYMNTDTGDTYKCTSVENGVYTWKADGLAPEIGVILPETVISHANYVDTENAIVVGETYTVTVNGTSYTCVAVANEFEGIVYIELGNGTIPYPEDGYEDNGLPFFIETMDGVEITCYFASGEDSTVSITGNVYNPVEKKYLPQISNDDLPKYAFIRFSETPVVTLGETSTHSVPVEEMGRLESLLHKGPVNVHSSLITDTAHASTSIILYKGGGLYNAFAFYEDYFIQYMWDSSYSEVTIRSKKLFDA